MLIDVHFHPFEDAMDPDTGAVMARARDAGVVAAVAAGLDAHTNRWVLDAAGRIPGLAPAVGYHPWFLEPTPDLADLEALAADPRVVALGEIGLDGKIGTPAEVQERCLRSQLALARNLGLPVIVHARGAVARVVSTLQDFPEVTGVLHSFPGSAEATMPLIDAGWCVSFSGSVTRPRARRVRALAQALPIHGVLVETDAPAIGLEGLPPEAVEPRHVVAVAAAIAALREMDLDALAAATCANCRRLFGPRLDRTLEETG